MEVLIVLVIILVGLIILGVSLAAIAKGLLILSAIVLGLMLLFFAVMSAVVIAAKPAKGEFDGLEKKEGTPFVTAYYRVGEERIANIFPAENIMQKRIYSSGEKKLRVLSRKKSASVIDRHSMLIIFAGLVLTLPSMLLVLNMLDFIERISGMLT